MIFTPTAVEGAFLVDLERHEDERGFLARTFCAREFAERGLETTVAQCSLSRTTRRSTLRGLHFQRSPHREAKLVRCARGRLFDVVLDLRPDSPTFLAHVGVELDPGTGRAVYVPPGCAHGFQTLEDDTETLYQMSEFYAPHTQDGVRWNDPAFGIEWPLPDPILSERDRALPDFRP